MPCGLISPGAFGEYVGNNFGLEIKCRYIREEMSEP